MKTKRLFTAILAITAICMIGCQSYSDSDNESKKNSHAKKIQPINKNAKLMGRYDKSGRGCRAKNLEIWFDKIYFKDTTNVICLSSYYEDYEKGDPIEKFVKVWSDGAQTVFSYYVDKYNGHYCCGTKSVMLIYEGDKWKKKYFLNFMVEYLNDIDEDGIVEVTNDLIYDPQPIYIDSAGRTFYYENEGRVEVYKYKNNSLLLDKALSKEVTSYVYAPTFIDTTIRVGQYTDLTTGEFCGGWDTTVTLVEWRSYLDLNKYSLYELGLRKRK